MTAYKTDNKRIWKRAVVPNPFCIKTMKTTMANKEIKIGDSLINETSRPYMIAEIGINHNGDINIAKKLIDAANATGWNNVKFQKRTPELAVPEAQKNVMRETPWGTMTYLEYKYRVEFEKPEYDIIDAYCKDKGMTWSASPWDMPSLEFLLKYDIEFWIELAEGKKYTIKNSQSISDLLKDTKNQMQRTDFLKFCSDLKIHFKFIKKEAKKEEASSSQSDIKLSFSNNTISYEELNKLLFEHFYYENIINNKALYNIKRASPFFYLLSLIYLCQDNFNSYFNIDKIPLQSFENLKMSSRLCKQVRDPYAISSK